MTQSELHNRIAGEIVASIVRPPIEAGGTMLDVMVVLESVVTGVILAGVRMGGDERVLDTLVEGVKARLANQRLGPATPHGQA